MMTRETKAGLVVAGSFLCLVVVVVIARLRQASPDPVETASPPEQAAAPAVAEPPKTEPVQTLPSLQQPPAPGGLQLTQATGTPSEPPPPEPPPAPPLMAPDTSTPTERPATGDAPPPAVGPPEPPAVRPAPTPDPVVPPGDVGPPPDNPPQREAMPSPEPPVVPPPSVRPPPSGDGTSRPAPEPPALPDPGPIPPVPPDERPARPTPAPPAPPPAAPVLPPDPPERSPGVPTPAAPPTVEPRPAPLSGPPARPAAPEKPPSPVPARPEPPTDTRPPAVPAPPPERALTAAAVDSWDEEIHGWKANDTFGTVSQAYYGTTAYTRALIEFNRVHPQGAEGLRANPPVVRPGEKVFIPPIRILEKDHAALVSGRGDPPAPAAPAGGSASGYRVGRDGEMFLDVARHTGAKWEDIYLLNRQHDPSQPIPAGVLLQLPAGARVPAENRP